MTKCVLRDLIEISFDGEWGKGAAFDGSIEMLAIRGTDFQEVRRGSFASTPHRYIAERHAARKQLEAWDVVIEVAGGTKNQITGRTLLIRPEHLVTADLPLTCASFSRFIRFEKSACSPEFMFWYLQYLYLSGAMDAYHTQHTGVARFQWSTFSEQLALQLPERRDQERIASTLSPIDQLIAINARRMAVLDDLARTIFREWFVALRFPGFETTPITETEIGRVPDGWKIVALGSACDLTMGQSPKSEFYNDIGDGLPFHQGVTDFGERYPMDRLYCTSPGRTARAGDVLFSVRAPVGRLNLADKTIVLGRGLAAIRARNGYQEFLWEQLREQFKEEDIMGNGAIFASVTKKDMEEIRLLQPPDRILKVATDLLAPLHKQIRALTTANTRLEELRETLLPRLMIEAIESATDDELLSSATQ